MADQQKRLVRRGGGGGDATALTTAMIIEEAPPQSNGSLLASSETDDVLSPPTPSAAAATAAVGISPRDVVDDHTSAAAASAPSANQIQQPLSIDQRYEVERQTAKVRHWRDSPHAVGLVEVSWRDELGKHRYSDDGDGDANGPNRGVCADCCKEDIEPTCGCLLLSGVVCHRVGANRVGNFAVLKESAVLVEDDDTDGGDAADAFDDEERMDGGRRKRRVRRTRLDLVVGPYWPMLVCVTYPLIFGISGWTAVTAIPNQHPILVVIWAAATFGLIYSLFSVACRDPGILPRYREVPKGVGPGEWRWNDQAQTYRPRGAIYDPDCAAVIEDFDHTCPWTGTAIGKRNMPAFQAFVALVFVCLIMDILLLTKAF